MCSQEFLLKHVLRETPRKEGSLFDIVHPSRCLRGFDARSSVDALTVRHGRYRSYGSMDHGLCVCSVNSKAVGVLAEFWRPIDLSCGHLKEPCRFGVRIVLL